MGRKRSSAIALKVAAIGVASTAAIAVGATAIGALVVGAVAVGRVMVDRADFKDVRIERLTVGELIVERRDGR